VPAVDRLLRAVIRPVPREEGVAGAVVAVELIVLAGALQSLFGLVDVLRRGIGIFVPNRPNNGQLIPSVKSIGATGWFLVNRDLSSTTTLPPQQSTAAWTRCESLHATRYVCRPPEQNPITPTLPLACGCERRKSMAPVTSPSILLVRNPAGLTHVGDDRLVGAVADRK